MAEPFQGLIFFLTLFSLACLVCNGDTVVKPCVYFGSTRSSSPQSNLSNCTWYRNNACCKRTEVASVFGSMFPLYGASQACRNKLNYMMCYICSPDQMEWFDEDHLIICKNFCEDAWSECTEGSYLESNIGSHYNDGSHFCKSMGFTVKEGAADCFNFDPEAFGSGVMVSNSAALLVLALFLAQTLTSYCAY